VLKAEKPKAYLLDEHPLDCGAVFALFVAHADSAMLTAAAIINIFKYFILSPFVIFTIISQKGILCVQNLLLATWCARAVR